MAIVKDKNLIAQLNKQRQEQLLNDNLQKELTAMRNNEMRTGSPEEEKGLSGIWSDVKSIPLNMLRGIGDAVIAAPHAIPKAAGQAVSLPLEIANFLGKTAQEGYKPENLPRFTKNLAQGFYEGLNKPSELASYLERKEVLPGELSKKLKIDIPNTGLKEGEESGIIQGMPFMGAPTFKLLEEMALTGHAASRPIRKAMRRAERTGVDNLNLPEHFIEDARQYLPDDYANNLLLDNASRGNVRDLFTLQSDIGKRGSQNVWSLMGSDRNLGFDMLNYRRNLLDAMRQEFIRHGQPEVADLMRKGQRLYRRNKTITRPALLSALALSLGARPIKGIYEILKTI